MQLFRSIWGAFSRAWAAERVWRGHTFPTASAEAEVITVVHSVHAHLQHRHRAAVLLLLQDMEASPATAVCQTAP